MSASAPRPGRKRSETSRQAILQAALTFAREEGLGAVTMEGIASRAGVGKQTVYRWWTSKGAVVLEALKRSAAQEILAPHGSSLRDDLRRFLGATFAALTEVKGNAQLLRGLMAQAQFDDGFLAEFRSRFVDERRAALRGVFERARDRGELRTGFELEVGVDIAFGVLWYRLLVGHQPLDKRLARQLADAIVLGAQRDTRSLG